MKVEFSGQETYQVNGTLEVDPKDFLHCEDEDEIRDEMSDLIWESDDRYEDFVDGDVRIRKIPKEFFDEWSRLKLAGESPKSKFDEALGELIKKSGSELPS